MSLLGVMPSRRQGDVGGWDTGLLTLTDTIPANTAYVSGSVDGGSGAEYDAGENAIVWSGIVPAGGEVHISYQVKVTSDDGAPFTIENVAEITGPPQNLSTLPRLAAYTHVEAPAYQVYLLLVQRGQ